MSFKARSLCSAAALAALASAAPAWSQPTPTSPAQDPSAPPATVGSPSDRPGATAQAGGASQVDTVVVTAQRREENIQKVPIAVTAIGGPALEAQGVIGFRELGTRVPSLRFGAGVTGGENVITMRGLGSQNTTPGGDSPVAYNVDGVYLQRTTAIDPEFYDISRIEVLRGPQGTLYGRNSVGGSINVITNKPSDRFSASIDGLLGDYDAHIVRGYVTGPLADSPGFKASARLTGVWAEHDPYAENLSSAPTATHNQDAQDYHMLRGQLALQFGPNVDLLLLASYGKSKDQAAAVAAWWEQPARYINPPLGIPIGSKCDFSTAAKFQPRQFCHDAPEPASNETQLYAATLNWQLPFATFTSVTAFGKSDVDQKSDGDGSDLPMALGSSWVLKNSQFSQEVRLASKPSESPLKWLAGFIYFYARNFEDFGYMDLGYNDTAPFPQAVDQFNFLSHGTTKTQSWAPFGQLEYDLSKTSLKIPLTLIGGIRYTSDHKYGFNYLDYQLPLLCGGTCANPQGPFSKDWGQVTGKFGANYQLTDTIMIYASAARGYLAGGNIIGLANIYGPESMWSYEGGFKSRFFDNRLQLNIAGYHEEIKNLQVFIQSSTQSGINNVNGETDVNGLEVEVTAVPVPNLHLNGTLTLTDADYGRYITTDTRFSAAGPGCDPVTLLCNFEGHRLNQTPPYTVNFGAEYRFETAWGTFIPRVDTFFSGEVQFLPDNYPTSVQKPYHMTNLRLTWIHPTNRYRVEAFVNNLEDEDVISNDGLQSITLGQQVLEPDNFVYFPPRTFGVRLTLNFGAGTT